MLLKNAHLRSSGMGVPLKTEQRRSHTTVFRLRAMCAAELKTMDGDALMMYISENIWETGGRKVCLPLTNEPQVNRG
jgi:hypothetical protein